MHTETRKRRSVRPSEKHGRTRFALRAPSAQAVHLAGSFNDWKQSALPMKRERDGVWSAEVELQRGHHEFKFIVDGEWCCDVNDGGPSETAEGCVPNGLGTMNRVIEIA